MGVLDKEGTVIKAELDLLLNKQNELTVAIATLRQNIKTHREHFLLPDLNERNGMLYNVFNKLKGVKTICKELSSLAVKRGFGNYDAIIRTILTGATEIKALLERGDIHTAEQADTQVVLAIERNSELALSELRKDIEKALRQLQEAQKVGSRR